MAFDVVVSSPRSLAEIIPLKKVLEDGGQNALANAIRGSGQGQIKLGALVYPIDLVMAEKIEDGWRYLVVTTRPIKYNESDEDGGASLNYPFAVFTWDWTSFGSSDGTIYTKAALSIDPDGHIQVTQFDGVVARGGRRHAASRRTISKSTRPTTSNADAMIQLDGAEVSRSKPARRTTGPSAALSCM